MGPGGPFRPGSPSEPLKPGRPGSPCERYVRDHVLVMCLSCDLPLDLGDLYDQVGQVLHSTLK